MVIEIVLETHSTSEDNEHGIAAGWNHSRLLDTGRAQAEALGVRRRSDGIRAVFASDLRRAVETAHIAFAVTSIPVFVDWRLRECDYGEWNGHPREQVQGSRHLHLDVPYPAGESWRQAVARVGRFLSDLPLRWDGARVLVIGHIATRWAFEHYLNGVPLETLAEVPFVWQEGWEYRLD